MKLKRLLRDFTDIELKGSKEVEISGLCSNSAVVAPGNLFIARKGLQSDGARYIPDAVAAGAAAVLTDMYDPSFSNVAQLIHPDPASIEGKLGAAFYQNASRELTMVGVTGTNGKTTTSSLIRQLFEMGGERTGLIGTVEYVVGDQHFAATRTTPDVVSNHKMLREMVRQGCQSAVMEVTSHGIAQGRVESIEYDIAIFTNLTQDHLDYHVSMEKYAATKAQLFHQLSPKAVALVNGDDPWAEVMVADCAAPVLHFGLEEGNDLRLTEVQYSLEGGSGILEYKGSRQQMHWPLIGGFNTYNVLAAVAACLVRGSSLESIAESVSQLTPVAGRLEQVPNSRGIGVFVDFAHSPDALTKALDALRPLTERRLIVVFGCGGDRDRDKRPLMGDAAAIRADKLLITSDNPRSEDPETICREIAAGVPSTATDVTIEVDRRQAIQRAIEEADTGDVVLIAGKGHETTQIFAHKTIEFDDRQVAQECLQQSSIN